MPLCWVEEGLVTRVHHDAEVNTVSLGRFVVIIDQRNQVHIGVGTTNTTEVTLRDRVDAELRKSDTRYQRQNYGYGQFRYRPNQEHALLVQPTVSRPFPNSADQEVKRLLLELLEH